MEIYSQYSWLKFKDSYIILTNVVDIKHIETMVCQPPYGEHEDRATSNSTTFR